MATSSPFVQILMKMIIIPIIQRLSKGFVSVDLVSCTMIRIGALPRASSRKVDALVNHISICMHLELSRQEIRSSFYPALVKGGTRVVVDLYSRHSCVIINSEEMLAPCEFGKSRIVTAAGTHSFKHGNHRIAMFDYMIPTIS